MFQKFKKILHKDLHVTESARILVTVSGGVDSVVLLDLFANEKYNISIAHCNFSLRENESDEDEKFVRALSERYNVPFYSKRFLTKEYAIHHGISTQMAARNLRYEWWTELVVEYGFDFIATAHHLNDQIETILLNLTKGTGIKGLTGIRSRRNNIIRPLLVFSKNQLINYAADHKLEYREDSSNLSNDYERNSVRNQVLPLLKTINPSLEKTFASTISHLNFAADVFDLYIVRKKQELILSKDNEWLIDLNLLMKEEHAASVLYELLKDFGYNSSVVESILGSEESGKMFYSLNYKLLRSRDQLVIRRLAKDEVLNFELKDENQVIDHPLYLKLEIVTSMGSKSRNIAYLDRTKLKFPLILRKWTKGDKFVPLGMKGFKKLSDYFIDKKFSVFQKRDTWLLASGEDIVWIVGDRIDERYKAIENTTRILKIHFKADA